MRKYLLLIILLNVSFAVYAQSVDYDKIPAWVDNFTENGNPDANWLYEDLAKTRTGKEYRYDLYQKNGKLNIKFIDKKDVTKDFLAMTHTSPKLPMLYGKVEIRAKLPIAKGIWPGIWLRTTRGTKADVKGEVDLIEWISCFNKHQFQANFHLWGNFKGKANNHAQYPKSYSNKKFDVTKYHVYSAEWDKEKLIVKVDGITAGIWYAKDYVAWPFTSTYELCLDLGYGGWGASCGYDKSKLPQIMKVDWVKYYKLKE